MKRRALLRYLHEHGCELFREGGQHSIFWNPKDGRTSAIPRHVEIKDRLAEKICEDLGVPKIGKE